MYTYRLLISAYVLDMRLLITFVNSLDPDHDRQNLGPDLDPIKPSDTLIVFLEEFFENVNFEKSQQRQQQEHEILPSMQRIRIGMLLLY